MEVILVVVKKEFTEKIYFVEHSLFISFLSLYLTKFLSEQIMILLI